MTVLHGHQYLYVCGDSVSTEDIAVHLRAPSAMRTAHIPQQRKAAKTRLRGVFLIRNRLEGGDETTCRSGSDGNETAHRILERSEKFCKKLLA